MSEDEPEFDQDKRRSNRDKHGLALDAFPKFDADPVVRVDERRDYGETRYRAFGRIDGIGHCVVYTVRRGRVRLISFRRAHEKEIKRHGI
ncbi:BrnT family toxin [Brevundimonas aurifodinae]|uniref:BrnT family toxin n=1 Tax=Brevundimonas subvibrioides TaxID=74313 RepID=A0A258FP13_9CAUL|nr:MAG: hypothetical protein B7Z42_12215 [Brevundimonas sp. 12-68-7]OYX33947.1 MAG: hypothetical protein B7Z01_07235 [Brevundimonas subvibrioides]